MSYSTRELIARQQPLHRIRSPAERGIRRLAGYGYRLWAVELHHGLKRQRHTFGAAQLPFKPDGDDEASADAVREVDYIAAERRDVSDAANRTHKFGLTKGDDDEGAAAAQGASIRFLSAKRENESLLKLDVKPNSDVAHTFC